MTKKIPKKLMKPKITEEQWLKFAEALEEQRHPDLLEERVRRETANQIFADLKAIAWEHIEPDKLEKFYEKFSRSKDKLAIAQKFSIIGFIAEKFDNVKKKYGVD